MGCLEENNIFSSHRKDRLKCCSVPVLSTFYMLAVLQQLRKVHLTTVVYCVYYGLQLLTVMQLG